MSNSPLSRAAVNLLLIAAMVIQPMAIVAAQGSCAQGRCCEAQTVCHACKCCEVKTDCELCGCCIGSQDDADSCCAKESEQSKDDDLFGEISDVVPEPPCRSEFIPNPSAEENGMNSVLRVCMCGIRSEPIGPATHRVPVPQDRELVVIAYLDHVASDAGLSIRPDQLISQLPLGDHSPHFSQRFLCIWRI